MTGAPETLAAWPCLTSLTCSRNCFDTMDSSLTLLPAVECLDLSGNNIATVQHLTACAALAELKLSNNCVTSLAQVSLCSGPLRQLVLQVRGVPSLQTCHKPLSSSLGDRLGGVSAVPTYHAGYQGKR